jgi:hypothetical protein
MDLHFVVSWGSQDASALMLHGGKICFGRIMLHASMS